MSRLGSLCMIETRRLLFCIRKIGENKLTEEQQWAKLKLVKEIADEVWG
ncbi:hypothetical protein [Butyrivibrio fibrisolvens]|nr:hypothetical protein [Butyrivibrio fibrisolvens]